MLTVALIVGAVVVILVGLKLRGAQTIESPGSTRLRDLVEVDPVEVERLLGSFELTPRETGFFGEWRETRIDGQRVAFLGNGGKMEIVVGNFDADDEQLTEVYLSKVSPTRPMPKGRRIDDAVGEAGQALAAAYFQNATISKNNPILRVAEIREALLALSSAVEEVGTFDTPGVQIWFDSTQATAESVAADVRNALAITKAMVPAG